MAYTKNDISIPDEGWRVPPLSAQQRTAEEAAEASRNQTSCVSSRRAGASSRGSSTSSSHHNNMGYHTSVSRASPSAIPWRDGSEYATQEATQRQDSCSDEVLASLQPPQQQLPVLPGILAGEQPASATAAVATPYFSLEQAQRVRERVRRLCGWTEDSFPGGHPISLCRANITEIFRNPYVVCEKTDGIRFLLLAASGCIFLLGRREEVRMLPFDYLPRKENLQEAQQLTLLDGELVQDREDDGQLINRYLIYDAICIERDTKIKERNLLARLAAVADLVVAPLRRLEQKQQSDSAEKVASKQRPQLQIYMKDFFETSDIAVLQRLALRLPHTSDGLIFTPVNPPYATGVSKQLLKWKPPHLNTADFSADALYDHRGIPRLFQLYVGEFGVRAFKGEFLAPYGHFYKTLLEMASRTRLSGLIIECYWYPTAPVYTFIPALRRRNDANESLKEFARLREAWESANCSKPFYDLENGTWKEGGWIAEKLRMDKLLPNSHPVVKKVMQSIDDSITFPTLLREFERYKQHGKKSVRELLGLPLPAEDDNGTAKSTNGVAEVATNEPSSHVETRTLPELEGL